MNLQLVGLNGRNEVSSIVSMLKDRYIPGCRGITLIRTFAESGDAELDSK